jgi:ribosomal protein S27AE
VSDEAIINDSESTIREFFDATEDYPDSEYNTFLINAKAMRRLCEDYRILAGEVARLRAAFAVADLDVKFCPACGPGTSISIEGPPGARYVECGACGTRGPRSKYGRAFAAWNALPR